MLTLVAVIDEHKLYSYTGTVGGLQTAHNLSERESYFIATYPCGLWQSEHCVHIQSLQIQLYVYALCMQKAKQPEACACGIS